VLERASYFAPEAPRTLEDFDEAGPIDVKGDFVRIRSRAMRFGSKEDEQRMTESERAVLTFQLLGTRQLEVEAPQASRIRGAKRHVVDAQYPHRSQSREAALPGISGTSVRPREAVRKRLGDPGAPPTPLVLLRHIREGY
jgi:hypothetical protein